MDKAAFLVDTNQGKGVKFLLFYLDGSVATACEYGISGNEMNHG